MKNFTLLTYIFLSGILILSCKPESTPAAEMDTAILKTSMTRSDSVKRGEYLSHMMGCHDCHTPKIMTAEGPVPDFERTLSGHPANEPLPKITDKTMIAPGQWYLYSSGMTSAVGPWGISFAANLTPDESGTGNWTFENFERAMREGKAKGLENGRTLLPPMPWQIYSKLSEEDLAFLWQYLRSLKPIHNVVPPPIPPA